MHKFYEILLENVQMIPVSFDRVGNIYYKKKKLHTFYLKVEMLMSQTQKTIKKRQQTVHQVDYLLLFADSEILSLRVFLQK